MPGTQGNASFDAPSYLDKYILDGVTLIGLPRSHQRESSRGANIWETVNGRTGVLLSYNDASEPINAGYFSWSFTSQADQEGAWYKLGELARSHRVVNFTDFGYVQEIFVAGPELTDFVLPSSRPTAKSVIGGSFPDAIYPVQAYINDVAQTVIESGSPISGEVKVVGTAVTTPALTADDRLEIRYVPTFRVVVVDDGPRTYPRYNDLQQGYRIVEIRS